MPKFTNRMDKVYLSQLILDFERTHHGDNGFYRSYFTNRGYLSANDFVRANTFVKVLHNELPHGEGVRENDGDTDPLRKDD